MKQWWPVVILIILAALAWWYFGTQTAPTVLPAEILTGVPNATYTNSQLGFSLQYPSTATSSEFNFDGYLPLTQTPVASFVLPKSMSVGTNLGEAGVYIGATTSPAIVANCLVATSDNGEQGVGNATIDGTEFTVSAMSDAGAGNFYESKIYRTVKNGTCLEIVELLHSGNIDNYPTGTVTAFDHAKFSGILDAIVQTYKPLPTGI